MGNCNTKIGPSVDCPRCLGLGIVEVSEDLAEPMSAEFHVWHWSAAEIDGEPESARSLGSFTGPNAAIVEAARHVASYSFADDGALGSVVITDRLGVVMLRLYLPVDARLLESLTRAGGKR